VRISEVMGANGRTNGRWDDSVKIGVKNDSLA
jgi:hypothetical protein